MEFNTIKYESPDDGIVLSSDIIIANSNAAFTPSFINNGVAIYQGGIKSKPERSVSGKCH